MREMKKLTVTLQNKTEHTEHIDAVALGGADLVERLLELVAAQRRVVQEGLADLRERFQGLVPHSIGRWIGGGNDRARGVLHASYTLGLLP